jgi:hypothetical protein
MFSTTEKPLEWVFRKKHKTHFRDRYGAQSDVHKSGNNTPGLYDGSAEARAILQGIIDSWEVARENIEDKNNICAVETLFNALHYLKGMDMQDRWSGTQEFFTDLGLWVEQLKAEPKEDLVQIEPTLVTMDFSSKAVKRVLASVSHLPEDFPEWNPNHEPKTGC